MRKIVCIMLILAVAACLFIGCTPSRDNGFAAGNEIITYQKIDPDKTQIVISRTGNIAVEGLCNEFEEKNPDIQVIYMDITGGTSNYFPLVDWLKNGYTPDIIISTANFLSADVARDYLENLSMSPVIQNYESAALQRTAVDGEIYWLPGPSDINAIMYNKTLFQQYNWKVPTTFDEFITLCDTIKRDTNGEVEPWNPNAKYGNEIIRAIEAFTYEEVFGGAENREWYNNLMAGKDKLEGHIEPCTDVIKTLAEHDILREEHFSYSATARGKEFAAGKIAMININLYNADNDEYDFGYMPYPTTKGDAGYLCDSYSCYVAQTKKNHTQAESNAITRFLNYFSSEEGQQRYIGDSVKKSNVKDVMLFTDDDFSALQYAFDSGRMFDLMDFYNENAVLRCSLYKYCTELTAGRATAEELIKQDDNKALQPAATCVPDAVTASVPENMTMLETSFFMADVYREAADAEIGLIAHNSIYRGNMMKLFSGSITENMVTVFKPRSFANGSLLEKVTMTGRQISEALNNPLGNGRTENCIYAYSGLLCEVAPWNEPGNKYISVKLRDGSELEPEKLYTVAAWGGTIDEKYITGTPEAIEGSWESMMTEALQTRETVVAKDNERISLKWD